MYQVLKRLYATLAYGSEIIHSVM